MIRHIATFVLLLVGGAAVAQSGGNPFELTPRLGVVADPVAEDTTAEASAPPPVSTNPFDLVRPEERAETPAAAPNPEPEPERPVELLPVSVNDEGLLFGLTILLLLLTALSLVFFRSLYQKGVRAILNDNLLNQLYRESEAQGLGAFLIGYVVFFLIAGFFIYLLVRHFGVSTPLRPLPLYLALTGGVTILFLGKHLLLSFLGYVFPIGKEVSRYSFTIIVFALIISLLLMPASVLIAYGPRESSRLIIYLTFAVLLLLYLLRSLRGIFIANRFLFGNLFHFLLYICTVEIAPVLLLYKFFVDEV